MLQLAVPDRRSRPPLQRRWRIDPDDFRDRRSRIQKAVHRGRRKEKGIALVEPMGNPGNSEKKLAACDKTNLLSFVLQVTVASGAWLKANQKGLQHRTRSERDHDFGFGAA